MYYSTVFGVLQDLRGEEVKYSALAECEIIHCVNCEISHFVRCEMKFALHICEANISQRSYFTWALPNFTRRRRISLKKESKSFDLLSFFWRRHPDLNRGIRVLQTRALPLGYGAVFRTEVLYHAKFHLSMLFVNFFFEFV